MNDTGEHDEPLHDLLDALRGEWRNEEEGADLPAAALEDCDDATQLSVAWLRAAWTLEAEGDRAKERTVPLALARAASRIARPRRRRRVAASLLLAAAALLAAVVLRGSGAETPADVSDTPTALVTPADGTDERVAPPAESAAGEFDPDHFRSRDDGIELVRGSVRLVLLTRDE